MSPLDEFCPPIFLDCSSNSSIFDLGGHYSLVYIIVPHPQTHALYQTVAEEKFAQLV